MAPESGSHRAQPRHEDPSSLNTPAENVSPIFRVSKAYELPDFRAGLLLQHGDRSQEVVVDNDVADYVITLGLPHDKILYNAFAATEQNGRLTREQIADEMETTPNHVRSLEARAEMALADAIIQPVKHDDEDFHDPLFRLELKLPETQDASDNVATVTGISDALPASAAEQKERPAALKGLLDEMRPFLTLQERVVDVVERHTTDVAGITDTDELIAVAVKENVVVPITKPGDPLTIMKLATPSEYFDQQVEHHSANDLHVDDARSKATVDLQGKVAARRTRKELNDTIKTYPLSTEQIVGAEEIAEQVFTAPLVQVPETA
jgi:hypothetical protein